MIPDLQKGIPQCSTELNVFCWIFSSMNNMVWILPCYYSSMDSQFRVQCSKPLGDCKVKSKLPPGSGFCSLETVEPRPEKKGYKVLSFWDLTLILKIYYGAPKGPLILSLKIILSWKKKKTKLRDNITWKKILLS